MHGLGVTRVQQHHIQQDHTQERRQLKNNYQVYVVDQTSIQQVLKELVNMARVQLTLQQHTSTFKWDGNN